MGLIKKIKKRAGMSIKTSVRGDLNSIASKLFGGFGNKFDNRISDAFSDLLTGVTGVRTSNIPDIGGEVNAAKQNRRAERIAAVEDYDKNTLEHLELLLTTGEVIGDTKQGLSQYNQLDSGKLQYKIPYPVAMDSLVKENGEPSQEKMNGFINNQIPNFDSQPQEYKDKIYERVKEYFKSKEFSAETFEMFSLQGTPSTILVDRKGILRDVSFGQNSNLESMVKTLIGE